MTPVGSTKGFLVVARALRHGTAAAVLTDRTPGVAQRIDEPVKDDGLDYHGRVFRMAVGDLGGGGYRNRTDLANSLQFTVRTLADIEHGVRKASPGTYAMLENKLSWAPGSIDTILAGGEPQELVSTLRRTNPNALSRVSTEELLLELRRRIIARDTRHDTWDDWDGGLDPRGDWPEQG